ncbi:kinesin-like protein KIF28P [Protopterus annectens]|uniref:kinesin-like protein KIF28P n=1 Tax=Protopterus annectens TaxID=7888 RepID=UPI001CFB3BCB|nr:kinesin-like protein KIF28P [Protopterus annectens]
MDSVKVAVRVRPFSQREKDAGSRCMISMNSSCTSIYDPKHPKNRKTFKFDLAYWSHSGFVKTRNGMLVADSPSSRYADQKKIFNDIGRSLLDNAWQGYNATLLAYGQTGSGKSYTVIGYGANQGLIPMICKELFNTINNNQDRNRQYQVSYSMLEIYNEQIKGLLSKTKQPGGLKLREDQQTGFYVEGLKCVPCENYAQIESLMVQGTKMRTTAATNMNSTSSRSHMVITIQFKQIFLDEKISKQSNITLVDLAGSERQKSSGSEGDRLREGTSVNLSLATLGNVISALAEAATGKKVLHIPYRDSVLTKLLQSALGGNSRTVMIAALSPADICYEETLSSLRYAERAKKIRNKAIVNESPTEKIVKELKAENARLLSKLSRLGNSEKQMEDEAKDLQRLVAENELQIQAVQTFWEERLKEAQNEWEEQCAAITQERHMIQLFPYIVNVNEDPQLSGVVKYFIQKGVCKVGQDPSCSPSIILKGLGIMNQHATFTNLDGIVTLEPSDQAKVYVNGTLLITKVRLKHSDRIIFGSNSTYLYTGFPCERLADIDLAHFDYDFFQSEMATAEGFGIEKMGAVNSQSGSSNPSVLAVFHDYIKIMPLVKEANQMSKELRKDLKFEIEVKNLAISDSRGHDLEKEIIVKVTNQVTSQVWVWSKAKFINRKFLMEELYQHYLDGECTRVDKEYDPFWDPVEAICLGSAHVWLQPLAYCIKVEEQVEFLNWEGKVEAVLQIHLNPCSCTGQHFGEDDIVIDPTEMLDKRSDFQIEISQCLGVRWLQYIKDRGVQIGYCVYDHPCKFYTDPVWNNQKPKFNHKLHFTVLNVSQDYLNYLQTSALVVELWGLQEGCNDLIWSSQDIKVTDKGSIIIDSKRRTLSSHCNLATSDSQICELYLKLSKLEQETEFLREVNTALKEENTYLKNSQKKFNTTRNESAGSKKEYKMSKVKASSGSTPVSFLPKDQSQKDAQGTSCDAQFAKALKVFYQSMTIVQGQLLRLRRHRPPEDDNLKTLQLFTEEQSQMFKEFGKQLDACVCRLKADVSTIVKKKRESMSNGKS